MLGDKNDACQIIHPRSKLLGDGVPSECSEETKKRYMDIISEMYMQLVFLNIARQFCIGERNTGGLLVVLC